MQTTTVRAEHVPKRKYGPEDDFARKRGIEKSMFQFMTYGGHVSTTYKCLREDKVPYPVCALPQRAVAAARVAIGCISEQ